MKIFFLISVTSALQGFYGIIGPNIPIPKITNLFQLFTGNGIIQGVFIENDTITPIQHKIKTIPFHPLSVANTAIIQLQNKQYALFERDPPYQIDIDFANKQIHTIGKKHIRGVHHISGHSKLYRGVLHSLEYSILRKSVSLLFLTPDFQLMQKHKIRMNYIPLVHDFLIMQNTTIITDSPIQFSLPLLLQKKLPIHLNALLPTFIHVMDRIEQKTVYKCNTSFFVFHYAYGIETKDQIEVYAPLYYALNFSTIHIKGIYSKLVLHKKTKEITIESSAELEKYNLDFPVAWKEYQILRNIEGHKINGFIICKGLSVYRTIWLPLAICGEPSIFQDKLLCIGYDIHYSSYFMVVHLIEGTIVYYPLQKNATLGFHSVFFEK